MLPGVLALYLFKTSTIELSERSQLMVKIGLYINNIYGQKILSIICMVNVL